MPYIVKELRAMIDEDLARIPIESLDIGAINYLITRVLLSRRPACYQEYNELIGVLECCKLEFYRRACAPYEHMKMTQNGDVYEDPLSHLREADQIQAEGAGVQDEALLRCELQGDDGSCQAQGIKE